MRICTSTILRSSAYQTQPPKTQKTHKSFVRLMFTILLALSVSACATRLTTDIRERAQSVFRYHNQLVSSLILLSSDAQLSNAELDELEQAEMLMIAACKPLNQVAAKVRDGGKAGAVQRINIPRTLNRCERQTKVVEQLIAKF